MKLLWGLHGVAATASDVIVIEWMLPLWGAILGVGRLPHKRGPDQFGDVSRGKIRSPDWWV